MKLTVILVIMIFNTKALSIIISQLFNIKTKSLYYLLLSIS